VSNSRRGGHEEREKSSPKFKKKELKYFILLLLLKHITYYVSLLNCNKKRLHDRSENFLTLVIDFK
jgi:hypothetical protein